MFRKHLATLLRKRKNPRKHLAFTIVGSLIQLRKKYTRWKLQSEKKEKKNNEQIQEKFEGHFENLRFSRMRDTKFFRIDETY
jgi:hypothetical protein